MRAARQEEDERALLASALGVTDIHPAKLLLAIKECQDRLGSLGKEGQQLRAAVQEKDRLALELQGQAAKLNRSVQEAQEASKTAAYEKEEYKFLLNNLRDQFSEVRRQH
jgi:predicted RNase H-like nuclease (RuvC/YqgF family)